MSPRTRTESVEPAGRGVGKPVTGVPAFHHEVVSVPVTPTVRYRMSYLVAVPVDPSSPVAVHTRTTEESAAVWARAAGITIHAGASARNSNVSPRRTVRWRRAVRSA